ncbi:MAG: FHA domain-containing protein [Telluria sp.]
MAKIIVSHGDMVEQEVELARPRITIGRHPGNDVVIDHRAISGQHAVITVTATDIEIEDLGSTNGTYVNGQRVARQTLAERDVIRLAMHTVYFMRDSAPPAAAPVEASVEVINGPNAGKTLRLVKPLTTLGSPGVLVVVIGRQDQRFFIRQVDGAGTPYINGTAIRGEQRLLAHGEVIELAGTSMKFSVTS